MPHHERSLRWYLLAGALVLGGAAYGLLSGAWSFTLVLLLTGGIYFLVRETPPPVKTIEIYKEGCSYAGEFFPWTECKEFWLLAGPRYTELHIERKGFWKSDVVIQTGNTDPHLLRAVLGELLPERANAQERLLDTIIRICKL